MSHNKPRNSQKEQQTKNEPTEPSTTQYIVETVKQLQVENEKLKLELRRRMKPDRTPSWKIGIVFLIPGASSLVISILLTSSILAFIGLGLTFWGGLFLFARPIKYVRSNFLDSNAVASYLTFDRVVKDLSYKGNSFYIPPYPKNVYLPEHLKGLKDMIVFISAEKTASTPSLEELAQERFFVKSPKGVNIVPPGLGLLTILEKEFRLDFASLDVDELSGILPQMIIESSRLAEEIEIKAGQNQAYLRIYDSVYKNLYNREEKLESVHLLGCPIVSMVACALAKATGKIVTIQRDEVSPDNLTIQVWMKIGD